MKTLHDCWVAKIESIGVEQATKMHENMIPTCPIPGIGHITPVETVIDMYN